MSERRDMQTGDWIDAAFKLVIGVFLGIAADGLVHLVALGYWPVAVIILVSAVVFFFLYERLEAIYERIFPSGIRPAPKTLKQRPKPYALLFSLPLGILIGVLLARTGLSQPLLAML